MEAKEQLDLQQKFLKIPLKVLHIFGLWRKDTNVFLYVFYSLFFLFFTQYLYALFQIIYMVIAWGDLEKVAEASFLLLTQATLCLKIIIYACNINKFKQLLENMNLEIFTPKQPSQVVIVNSQSKGQHVEYFIFELMATSTVTLWAIFPLIDVPPGDRLLPLKAWYPVSQSETPFYEILYFYQIFGIWFSALINASIDRLSTSMTAFGCAQLLILRDNLENIETYALNDFKKLQGLNVDDNVNVDPEFIENRFVECIKHHKEIVKFVGELEKCFHLSILAQFAASVGIICMTGLQITVINPRSIKFATKISYLTAMLAQVFFICRIGNNISVISSDLTNAAYSLPWITRTKKFKKSLLIFMERLKKPIITRAGNFFPLSLQTYMSILRLSYSYFAVLKQLNAKNNNN